MMTYTFTGVTLFEGVAGTADVRPAKLVFTLPAELDSVIFEQDGVFDGLPLATQVFTGPDGRRVAPEGVTLDGVLTDTLDSFDSYAVIDSGPGAGAVFFAIVLEDEATYFEIGGTDLPVEDLDAMRAFFNALDLESTPLSYPTGPLAPGTPIPLATLPNLEIEGVAPPPAEPSGPTDGDDSLTGTPKGDRIDALRGDDTIDGLGGGDTLRGGPGDDLIDGAAGRDRLFGDGGNDTMEGAAGNDTLKGGGGSDVLSGGRDRDRLEGGKGHDSLDGGASNDDLRGQAGNDTLTGGGDRDTLAGGNGRDSLDGGAGTDSLVGGKGDDTLTGGGGRDTFVLRRRDHDDTVTDFETNRDTLALDARLWRNDLSVDQVIDRFAEQVGDDLVFDFGGFGRASITLENVSLGQIANDIDIV